MIRHQEVIQLVIAYTLAGAFVFTVIITCLSLIGWIKFADKKQQKKLFTCLIVELIAVSLGFFCGFLNFNPHQVAQDLVDQGKEIERLRRTNEETARELAQRSFIPLSTDNEKQFVNELSSFFRRWPAVTNIGLIVDTTEKRRRRKEGDCGQSKWAKSCPTPSSRLLPVAA